MTSRYGSTIKAYGSSSGLDRAKGGVFELALIERELVRFGRVIDAARKRADQIETTGELDPWLRSYKVPKLGPDGDCLEELADDEFPVVDVAARNLMTSPIAAGRMLFVLDAVMAELKERTNTHWAGTYFRGRLAGRQHEQLIKFAYRGEPSRPDFELSHKFAHVKGSNNSIVGMTGRHVLIRDVKKHMADGGCNYICFSTVESELCVPVFMPEGVPFPVGIIDVESTEKGHFHNKEVAACVIAAAIAIGHFGLFFPKEN